MSSKDNNRVLTRMGARKLSQGELDAVSGGLIPTRMSTLVTGTSSHPDRALIHSRRKQLKGEINVER